MTAWNNLPPHLMKRIRSDSITPASALPDCEPVMKYGNKITEVNGIAFDSKKEAAYYEDLLWQQAETIVKKYVVTSVAVKTVKNYHVKLV